MNIQFFLTSEVDLSLFINPSETKWLPILKENEHGFRKYLVILIMI